MRICPIITTTDSEERGNTPPTDRKAMGTGGVTIIISITTITDTIIIGGITSPGGCCLSC